MADEEKKDSQKEEFKVSGEELLGKVKELINEGNIRQITIKDKDENVIMSIPLTFGVVGAVFAPTLAAIGSAAALLSECTIAVVRRE